jgi:hypothetical protein
MLGESNPQEATVKKRNIVVVMGLVAALVVAAVPAFAQESTPEGTAPVERVRDERTWPPAWLDKTVAELQAQVVERAQTRIARIEQARFLDEDQKAERIAAIEDLVAAVESAETRPEVVGITISRTQLERRAIAAERAGTEPDYESHIADDLTRAGARFDRLSQVTDWAESAGEDVTAVAALLDQASDAMTTTDGGGTVTERHDAVHTALAALSEAAAMLDGM